MQALVPTGARNPNSHTAQQILDALRGVTGSRRLTFRYERLSSANAKLGDIDNVLSCSVGQNWLADIKRTAKFTLTDLGGIDYLSDRIKPYVRLHLAPYGTNDWVEWPQGVFLLSTPSRSADELGVVTREVEGYDALQVYADDLVTARYTVSGPGTTTLFEDFEDTTYNVTWSGTWARSNVTPQAGTWSLKAPTTAHSGTSDAVVTVPAGATTLTLWFKVSSENGFDYFRILRDGVLESQHSGEVAWTSRTISVAGVSAVTFRYTKDTSAVGGSDTAWVDSLTFSIPVPGAKYTDAVSNLLGSVPKNITASPLTLPTAKEWKPGTAKLAIINELLSAINYESLSFDEDGVAIVRPYTAPSSRAEEYVYADNAQSIMLPAVDQTLDLFSVPNQWVLVVSDPDRIALSATYTNADPASPTSTVRRQRTIVDFRTEQDAADQASLDAKAARLAFEASQIYEAIEFETGLMPIHSGNDVYRITFGPLAVDAKYSEHSWEMDLAAGSTMKHKARRVVNINNAGELGQFSYQQLANPARTEVTHGSELVAVFTNGSKTVTVQGEPRTFTEQKAPFVEDFARAGVTEWGSSPGGGAWSSVNGVPADYAIVSNKGTIHAAVANSSRYMRLSDTGVATFNWLWEGITVDTVAAGAAQQIGAVACYQDVDNHYRLRIVQNVAGTAAATIAKIVAGTETVIASAVTVYATYSASDVWNMRFTRDAAGLMTLTVWRNTDPEPVAPTRSVTDNTFTSGRIGVRALASTGNTNLPTFSIDKMTLTSANWANPPTVTHRWRVRLLDEPFAGQVDIAWLYDALADTSPDLLDVATQYLTGAAPIMDGSLQIGGDADYGPLYAPGRSWDVAHADDGTRQEGSDFNDYLGVNWVYPSGTDAQETHQFRCLDCSGYIRMVFAYRTGFKIPVTLDDPATFDGVKLPRTSGLQTANGPGVLVAAGTPPALDQVRPGDVVGFDADTTNPTEEEGQIDHLGIYLGRDDNTGAYRFISARKTANGPTLSDLGGPSRIDGTGLYGRSLRKIRRF